MRLSRFSSYPWQAERRTKCTEACEVGTCCAATEIRVSKCEEGEVKVKVRKGEADFWTRTAARNQSAAQRCQTSDCTGWLRQDRNDFTK